MIDLFDILFAPIPLKGPKSTGAQIIVCVVMMFICAGWFLTFLILGFKPAGSQTPVHCIIECLEALVAFGVFAWAASRIIKKQKSAQESNSSSHEGEVQ